eukprot:COSAG03_NODE_10539_length_644_cov_8.574312_1_plen_129_part_01
MTPADRRRTCARVDGPAGGALRLCVREPSLLRTEAKARACVCVSEREGYRSTTMLAPGRRREAARLRALTRQLCAGENLQSRTHSAAVQAQVCDCIRPRHPPPPPLSLTLSVSVSVSVSVSLSLSLSLS